VVIQVFSGCTRPARPVDPESLFKSSAVAKVNELGIYSDGIRIGTFISGQEEGKWQGVKPALALMESMELNLSFQGSNFQVSSDQKSFVTETLELLGSKSSISFGAGPWMINVLRNEDGTYTREENTGMASRREIITIPEGNFSSDVLHLLLHRFRGDPGDHKKLQVYNMTLGQTLPLEITFEGENDDLRLFKVSFWGMEEQIWLDSEGMVTGEAMALGVNARPPIANERSGSLPLEKVLTQTSVPSRGIPQDLASRERAVLLIEGNLEKPPDGPWQTIVSSGDGLVAELSRPVVPPPGERELVSYSLDEMGLNLDSERIQNLSAEITRGMTDPWEKAQAVAQWVYGRLKKSMRECFTALEVLEAGEGECQSHSILTISLLRAAGLPARFAYGVVYLPERGSYFFHTWVEVGVGSWIPMDPTLGSIPSGVDHLTLITGGYRDQFKMFPYILGQGGWRISFIEPDKPQESITGGRKKIVQ